MRLLGVASVRCLTPCTYILESGELDHVEFQDAFLVIASHTHTHCTVPIR